MFSWTSPPTAVGDFLYPNALAHDSGSLAFRGGMLPGADSDDGCAEALQRPGLSSITLWRRADPSIQTTFRPLAWATLQSSNLSAGCVPVSLAAGAARSSDRCLA